MKLPVTVIADALAELGSWTISGPLPGAAYSFPRQYDGCAVPPGHVLVIRGGLDAGKACRAFSAEQLLVFSSGGHVGEAGDAAGDKSGFSDVCRLHPETDVSADRILQLLTALFDSMEAWEEALDQCSHDLPGIQRMLEISGGLMGGSLGLIDVSYNMPAYTGKMAAGLGLRPGGGVQRPDDANIASLAEDPQMTALRTVHGVHVYENPFSGSTGEISLYCNMFRPGEKTYYNRLLFARDSGCYSDTDRFMLEILAGKIEKITVHLSTFALPGSELDALKKLILRAAEPDYRYDAAAAAALHPVKWRESDCFRLYIFSYMYPERDNGITEYMLRRIERLLPGSCGAVKGENILLLHNVTRSGSDIRELRSDLAEFLRENMYKAGISGLVYAAGQLRGAYLQAVAAFRLGAEKDPMFWYYLFEDYRMDYLIRKAAEEISPELLVIPALSALQRADQEKGTNYTETLRMYAAENFNVTRTAQRLFIHRTSLQDRLNRIRELTGIDLECPEARFDLLFSLRLLK